MNSTRRNLLLIPAMMLAITLTAGALGQDRVKIANGALEGVSDKSSGVRASKEFRSPASRGRSPLEAPTAGQELEGRPQGRPVRPALHAAGRLRRYELPLQRNGRGLPLPERLDARQIGQEKLPVLVYFFGGGFMAGDGSEPRYDGESMARRESSP